MTAGNTCSVPLVPVVMPSTAIAVALIGLLVGIAHGFALPGAAVGAAIGAVLAFMLVRYVPDRRAGSLIATGLFTFLGFAVSGLTGLVLGAIVGLTLGWFVYWLARGTYRRNLPTYASPVHVLSHNAFRAFCGAVLFFLIAPILTIMPLSFNAQDFFTFTPEMLDFVAAGYSLKHYRDFFGNPDWQQALRNSVQIAPVATLLSVSFGTLAAIGLSQSDVPYRRTIMAVLISPMIVPLIISAAGMYFFYSRIGLQGTYLGVVLSHAALGIPFVIITVTATLVGFDRSLTRAAAIMGAGPMRVFFRVQMPLILPGVISGGLFAFITSFDEVVVVLFVGSVGQKTLPWQMFIGLREQISPTILAVATILVAVSIVLLTTVELLRRRSERLRGITPG